MEIRIRNTGEVVTDITFRDMFRDRVLPALLTEEFLDGFAGGCDVVLEGPQATLTSVYQYSMRAGVEKIGSKWFTKYVAGPVFDTPEAEAAYKARRDAEMASAIRSERNRRLAECDWTQLADSPVSKEPWAAYRQALRDVTGQSGFPWKVEWPEQPK